MEIVLALVLLLLILAWIGIALTRTTKPQDLSTPTSDLAIEDAHAPGENADDAPLHLLQINGAPVGWSVFVKPEDRPAGAGVAVFVDTETTGLSRTDELIEIALIGVFFLPASGEIVGVWGKYEGQREPSCPMNPHAAAVHGMSLAQLRGKRLDEQRVEEILRSADIVIAHNASFDRRFVANLFPFAGRMEWLCSMAGVQWKSYGMPNRKLQTILKAHGVKPRDAHRALVDTVALVHILQLQFNGRRYFAEMLAGRKPRRARRARGAGSA